MSQPFYVTTPIYYVNDVPHLGTAYTTIVADALRRYHALRGRDARMLTGTDEHGLKIEREATAKNVSPKAFVDEVSQHFRTAWPKLLCEPNDFIRTTEPRHEELVKKVWERVAKNGDIYLGEHEGWYCVGCEEFKTEKELLPGNICPLHPNKPTERLKEPTYFFKLKDYEQKLLDFYDQNPTFIEPESRRNEVISFVKGGLRDLSVSRTSFSWGVPVPGDPKHVMYVWFDALANYWTALGDLQSKYWTPNGEVLHLVGKDILRFHTVYWPAFLLSAGLPLPTKVFAHGFLTIDGQKMSKSLRNAVDPVRLAETEALGGPDGLRHQLLRHVAFGQDGDFDHKAIIERYNADLGKNLGNLLSRTLGLCAKLAGNKVPTYQPTDLEHAFEKQAHAHIQAAANAWTELAPHRALEETYALASLANQYVDRAAPWAEAKKGNQARVDTTLALLLETLRALSVLTWPAIPRKADQLRAQLALPPIKIEIEKDLWPTKLAFDRAGTQLGTASALFPTIDKDTEKALLEKLQPKPEGAEVPPTTSAVPGHPSAAPAGNTITYDQFTSVDLRVGLVKTAAKVPKKDKLLQLEVDVGEEKPRTIIAGLALTFTPEQLVGQRVIVVANLAPRDFGKGLVSHGMLLATGPSEKLVLATAPEAAAPGAKLK
jgi:methionyl-tRNA synthetase